MNPIIYVDPDGRDIKLYNVTHTNNKGASIAQPGLSSKTEAAMSDFVKTSEGRAFLAQFAKAGDVVGGYKFTTDGKLSDVTLNIWDYSYEKGEIPSYAQPNSGSISLSDDKNTVTLKVVSNGADKTEVGETITHESQLHGYNIADEIKGKKVSTQEQDHRALKNNNTNHQGYKQYKSVQNQLQKIDGAYKKAFQKAQKDADKQY